MPQTNDPINVVQQMGAQLPAAQKDLGALTAASADAAGDVTKKKAALDTQTADFGAGLQTKAANDYLVQSDAVKFETPKPYQAPHETLSGFASLFSMLAVMAFSGGGRAKQNGLGAMAAMTGALKGWNAGEVQNYQRSMNAYNEHLKQIQMDNQAKQEEIQKIQRAYAVDKDAIPALTAKFTADHQGDYTSALVKQGRVDAALKYQGKLVDQSAKMASTSATMENQGRLAVMRIAAERQMAQERMANARQIENMREAAQARQQQEMMGQIPGLTSSASIVAPEASAGETVPMSNAAASPGKMPPVAASISPHGVEAALGSAEPIPDKDKYLAGVIAQNSRIRSLMPNAPFNGYFVPLATMALLTGDKYYARVGGRSSASPVFATENAVLGSLGMEPGQWALVRQAYKAVDKSLSANQEKVDAIASSIDAMNQTFDRAKQLASELGLNGAPPANAALLAYYKNFKDTDSAKYQKVTEYNTLVNEIAADYKTVLLRGGNNVAGMRQSLALVKPSMGVGLSAAQDAAKVGADNILAGYRKTFAQAQANVLKVILDQSTNKRLALALFGNLVTPPAAVDAEALPFNASGQVTVPVVGAPENKSPLSARGSRKPKTISFSDLK